MEANAEAYQERVVSEKKELDEKLDKLNKFLGLDPDLPFEDMDLLLRQKYHMIEYRAILGQRIARFKTTQPTEA